MFSRNLLLLPLALLALSAGAASAEDSGDRLDWSAWQRLPVFHNGRMMPLDTFARQTVDAICDRQSPTLSPDGEGADAKLSEPLFPAGVPMRFSAAELLFSWLVEPDRWENVPFLFATHETLREDWLDVPVTDTPGARRLAILGYTVFEGRLGKRYKYVSPRQVQDAQTFWDRLMEEDANSEDEPPSAIRDKAQKLYEAFAMYRLVTFDPESPEANRSRFRRKLADALDSWRELEPNLTAIANAGPAGELPSIVSQATDAMVRLATLADGRPVPLDEIEPPVAALADAAARLADEFRSHRDRLFDELPPGLTEEQLGSLRSRMRALAATTDDLARQTNEAHLALYDNGYSLRLVPGLNPAALENSRDPEDDAQPWANIQSLLYGSDELMAGYPPAELAEFRAAFAEVSGAYLDRQKPDRPARFSKAMARFAAATRALGTAIEPVRDKLPLEESDKELVALTAYPPPEATAAEVRYYEVDPFLWSWVVAALAMVFLGLSFGTIRKPMFWLGVATLVAAGGFTAYGLGMRVAITGWAPVTNMFETVIFVAMVVVALGLWLVLYPVFGPGLQIAWRMTGVPGTPEAGELTKEQAAFKDASWWTRAGWLLLVPRLALAAAIFVPLTMIPYGSGEGYTAVSLLPRAATLNDLTVWAVGLGVLVLTMIYVPRALLTFLLSVWTVPRTLVRAGFARPAEKAIARKPFALAGASVALLAALVAYFAPISGKNLGPLMPVLRDNFWLTLHVLTITASYGAGALAWGLGNLSLGYYLFGRYRDPAGKMENQDSEFGVQDSDPSSLDPQPSSFARRAPQACESLGTFTYKATQVTVLLLATGTILGALWADVSWGRFWGWDPKEVWALISTLVYLAMLHARYTNWIGHFGMAISAVLGASSIMMAWYGVNLLNSGLHTYGRVTGGTGIIVLIVAVNWLFALLAATRYLIETRAPHATPQHSAS